MFAPGTPGYGSRVVERSLAVLAIGAGLAFCRVARELLLPTVLAVFVAFTVHPAVAWLERRRVPHTLAAIAGTVLAAAVVSAVVALLYDRVAALVDELPRYQERIGNAYQELLRHYVRARAQAEQAVQPQPGTVKVEPAPPWGTLLLGTAQTAVGAAAGVTLALFVLYFALAEGPSYRRKFLAAAERSPERGARARAALDEVHRDLEQYMLNRTVLNAILGAVTAAAYAIYGLEHAAVWGLTTGLFHFIPYIGPAVGLVFPTAMAVLQYGTVKDPIIAAAIYTALVAIQGNLVDPIFLGKQLRLNSFVVFLGSIFWFWIWGPIGLFLAVPLLSIIRIVCKYVPRLQVFAEFLAE